MQCWLTARSASALLPPVLPIVLYNGESRWHAAEDVMELIAAAPGLLSGFRPSMRYLLIDEGRYSDSELASQRNIVAAIFRLEQQPTAAAVRDVTSQLSMWLVDSPDIRQLVSGWMLSTLGPRFGIDVTEADLGQLAEVKGIGVMMIERLEARERSIREEGKLEGKLEGTREGEQRPLIRQLKHKFGELSHEFQAQVDQASLGQLEHWLDNILDARTLDEVFTDSDAMH